MNDTALPRYRFLSGFDFCVVDYELYCYPWLPCSKKRVRAVLRQFRNKKPPSQAVVEVLSLSFYIFIKAYSTTYYNCYIYTHYDYCFKHQYHLLLILPFVRSVFNEQKA